MASDRPCATEMESLWLLIPLSAVLVLLILGVFGWAVQKGQFEDLEHEAERILTDEAIALDANQPARRPGPEES